MECLPQCSFLWMRSGSNSLSTVLALVAIHSSLSSAHSAIRPLPFMQDQIIASPKMSRVQTKNVHAYLVLNQSIWVSRNIQ